MNKSSHTISSRQNLSSASLKLRNYVFTKTWKLAIGISENKYKKIVGFHATENFSVETECREIRELLETINF